MADRARSGRPELLLLLCALLAIGVSSCGGGDEPDGPATGPLAEPTPDLPLHANALTKAQYIAEADEFCRESLAAMRRDMDTYREQRPRAGERAIFLYASTHTLLPHLQFWYDDISYIGAPQGTDRPELEPMLRELQAAVYAGEERRISRPEQLAAVFERFNRMARRYGFEDCLVLERSLS